MHKLDLNWVRTVAFCLIGILNGGIAHASTLSCSSSNTLENLIDCIWLQMPQHGSGGYVAPTTTQQADFRAVVGQMLNNQCDFNLPTSLAANMAIRTFVDSGNNRSYCLLMEVTSTTTPGVVDKGWGTFITYPNATRQISQQAPHPKYDSNSSGSIGDSYSQREAIRIFKNSDSRSFMMAGARRSANMVDSSCETGYYTSDAAHNLDNMFVSATQALETYYSELGFDWTEIQWHTKDSDTCTNDIFMSEGMSEEPAIGSKLQNLKTQIKNTVPGWVVQTYAENSSCLNATENIQGRVLNDVRPENLCTQNAKEASHKFIHIEQSNAVLANFDQAASNWATAILAAFPAGNQQGVPLRPTGLTATAGNHEVNLQWNAVAGATSYTIKRSSSPNGNPTITTSTTNSYLDTGRINGNTYYYMVTASNAVGPSYNSNQVSAVPVGPPFAPTGVSASGGPGKITVTWTASVGATSYSISRSTTSNGAATVVGSTTGSSFENTGLTAGQTFYYKVKAVNANGNSSNSSQVSASAQ